MSAKRTLEELRAQHHFDIVTLAARAAVTTTEVVHALRREPISKAAATAILDALSRQFRQRYTFDTVDIKTTE